MAVVQSYLTYHMQDPFTNWNKHLEVAANLGYPFRSIKVFHPEDYPQVKAVSPKTEVVYRSWADKSGQGRWMQMALNGQAYLAANEFIDSFIGSVQTYMPNGYIESINEEYPTGNLTKTKAIVDFDMAFINALASRLPGRKAVVFTAAVGNPGWNELYLLTPLARLAVQRGAAFGYHGYHPVRNKVSGVDLDSAKTHLHLRYEGIDAYLAAQGYKVKWFIGEAGAMGVQVLDPPPGGNWGMSVVNGWKHSEVWGGDVAAYMNDLAHLDYLAANGRVAKEGRLLGIAIFTSRPGTDESWKYFNVVDNAAYQLALVVGKGVVVSGETLPPPADEFKQKAWDVTVQMQVSGDGGLRLNHLAGIQQAISADNRNSGLDLQVVTDEVVVDGKTVQAAESLTERVPRRVYVWEPGVGIWHFEAP